MRDFVLNNWTVWAAVIGGTLFTGALVWIGSLGQVPNLNPPKYDE